MRFLYTARALYKKKKKNTDAVFHHPFLSFLFYHGCKDTQPHTVLTSRIRKRLYNRY